MSFGPSIELRCNGCLAVFPENEAIDEEACPECGCDSLFERDVEIPVLEPITVMPVRFTAPELVHLNEVDA